jgi:DNA-binding response OmpR family regulator
MARLLIVDDEEDVREFAANFFRKRKIDTATADSGETALEKIKAECPELVLLDIRLGGISGIETLKAIREFNQQLKVIMVTGTRPEENEAHNHCLQLGACGYVHKPLQLHELERIVMQHLNPTDS